MICWPKILLATNNQGKFLEFKSILKETLCAAHFVSTADVGLAELDPEEDGISFAENSLIKAKEFALAAQLPAISDDSGLVVDALGGFPGVASRRWYAGTDADRVAALLEKMSGQEIRTASFVSSVCLYDPATDQHWKGTGSVKGTLLTEPRGTGGFGYDSIFVPDGYQLSFAELDPQVKNTLSHRFQAITQLAKKLESTE